MPNAANTVRAVRAVALTSALVWTGLGWAWFTARPWAVALWPWPELPMTHVLLASMALFIALVWATVARSGEPAALAGAGLNIGVACAGAGMQLGRLGAPLAALAAWAAAAFGALLFLWARRQPIGDARVTPPVVRAGFVAFSVVLTLAGAALAFEQQVFPWPLHPSSMPPIGALFLGAAAYFAHAALHPRWAHAAPPLWGFLAYDLVLVVPYLRLLGGGNAVDDYYGGGASSVNMTSLTVYLGVIAASAALALYCLLVHPQTRLLRRRQ